MQLSEKALSYLSSIGLPAAINSNVLITDLENIIYTATVDLNDYYFSKTISTDLLTLIKKWQKLPVAEDVFFMQNNPSLKIINNDTQRYSAQMIFPIYLDNKIERSCYLF